MPNLPPAPCEGELGPSRDCRRERTPGSGYETRGGAWDDRHDGFTQRQFRSRREQGGRSTGENSGGQGLDITPVWTDSRAHRATRVASDLIESTARGEMRSDPIPAGVSPRPQGCEWRASERGVSRMGTPTRTPSRLFRMHGMAGWRACGLTSSMRREEKMGPYRKSPIRSLSISNSSLHCPGLLRGGWTEDRSRRSTAARLHECQEEPPTNAPRFFVDMAERPYPGWPPEVV